MRKRNSELGTILSIVLALVLAGTLVDSFAVIPSGHTGVRTIYGQVEDKVLPHGISVKIPFVQRVHKVNNRQQEVVFKDRIWGESAEQTVVFMENVVVTYRINPEYSAWIFENVTDYKQNALPSSLVASAMKNAMVALPTRDVTNRSKIEPLALSKLQEAIDAKYGGERVVSIVTVNIDNMDFEDSYNAAIAAKQVTQMQYEQKQIENNGVLRAAETEAEQKRIAAQAEADRKRIAAEADAQAILAVAEAQAEANKKIADSITPSLIEYEKATAWDGKLPKVSGANAWVQLGIEEEA